MTSLNINGRSTCILSIGNLLRPPCIIDMNKWISKVLYIISTLQHLSDNVPILNFDNFVKYCWFFFFFFFWNRTILLWHLSGFVEERRVEVDDDQRINVLENFWCTHIYQKFVLWFLWLSTLIVSYSYCFLLSITIALIYCYRCILPRYTVYMYNTWMQQ